MISYGEPYAKMRGLARLSDAKLADIIVWAYWSGVSLFGVMLVLVFIDLMAYVILAIAAFAAAWVVLTFAQTASWRRRNTWRPITKPIIITDVVRISKVNDADPSHVVKDYLVSVREDERRTYKVVGEFPAELSVGSQVTGDIMPNEGTVRDLEVVTP